jgi:hypothetical protein
VTCSRANFTFTFTFNIIKTATCSGIVVPFSWSYRTKKYKPNNSLWALQCACGNVEKVKISKYTQICKHKNNHNAIQWNLGSRTPLFTNNSVHEQIFRAKKSRMTNGVSDYEHESWQQRQAESIGAGVSVAG